jgi:hypothetical protein
MPLPPVVSHEVPSLPVSPKPLVVSPSALHLVFQVAILTSSSPAQVAGAQVSIERPEVLRLLPVPLAPDLASRPPSSCSASSFLPTDRSESPPLLVRHYRASVPASSTAIFVFINEWTDLIENGEELGRFHPQSRGL